nr:uncharacterized protein LOC128691542 [Cherax quadricarinatus]
METECGRGGVRSGRAVVGLDVVSHTLPRNFRTPVRPPCCQPRPQHTRPDPLVEPECACCRPDLCSGDPSLQCQAFTPYPAHIYPTVLRGGWEGGADDCATCRLQASLPCPCRDQRCIRAPTSPMPCTWGSKTLTQQGRPATQASYQDLPMTRASSMCTLPKLMSVEERLTTALGHPLDIQPPPHKHTATHVNTSSHPAASHTYTQTKTQGHLHSNTHNHKGVEERGNCRDSAHSHAHAHGLSRGWRLSRSVESLPKDIKEHILKCQCSCDHLGYGNFSATSLHHLPGMGNGCSSLSTKTNSSHEDLPTQELTEMRHRHKGGVEVPAHVWGGVCLVLVLAGVAGVGVSVPLALRVDHNSALDKRLDQANTLLKETPLVDG